LQSSWRGAAQLFIRQIGPERAVGLLLIGMLVSLRIWDPALVEEIRLKTFDIYQEISPRQRQNLPVTIVDIDEASLARFGQWPWPRTRLAAMVDKLTAAGAVAIAFDVVFPEPDRTSPDLLADSIERLDEATRAVLRSLPSNDAAFADSISRSRVVLGESGYHSPTAADPGNPPISTPFALRGGDPRSSLIRFPGMIRNVAPLEKAAAGRGIFTILPEFDGLVRRVPLIASAEGKLSAALVVDMLRVATGGNAIVVRSGPSGVEDIVVGGVQVPTDQFGQVWIHFATARSNRFISAADVLDGVNLSDKVAGRLVLIGTSATGLLDLKATPAGAMPGVAVHAQLLETILGKSALDRPVWTALAEVAFFVIVGALLIYLIPLRGAAEVFVLGACVAAVAIAISWLFFVYQRVLVDASYPLGVLLFIYVVLVFVNYTREEGRRKQIRTAFSQYLSPKLIEQLTKNPEKLVLGGETKEMTIMFSDVRDFTAISERYKDAPHELTRLINRILSPLSDAVTDHKGTIDKYMGDNIMAFWNAPLADDDHAHNACLAALDMIGRLEQVNEERRKEAEAEGIGFVRLRMGIGINTGSCVVGNMGSRMRFDYTVLGDSVNLASRLEGQSKNYGRPIVLGERTARLVEQSFALLELDFVRVKGKKEPERIFTILGPAEFTRQPAFQKVKQATHELLDLYRRREWEAAKQALERHAPAFGALDLGIFHALYVDRVEEYTLRPPPPDWDGAYVSQTK
jgi:adenylate cyclase